MFELVLGRKLGRHDRLTRARNPHEKLRKPMVDLRSDDKVDHRGALQDFLAFGLGDTTGNCHNHVAALAPPPRFEAAQLADLRIDLFGRLLADMAGIEDDKVGILGCG